jgi:hypothetical protein
MMAIGVITKSAFKSSFSEPLPSRSMNYSASGIATLQKRKRLLRSHKSLDSTILIYDTPIPIRHEATINHPFDLVRGAVGDVELDWFLRIFGGCLVVIVAHALFSSLADLASAIVR